MPEIETIKEKALSLVEVNSLLDKIKKRDKELGQKGQKTQEYINKMVKIDEKKAKEIKSKLEKTELQRLKQKHIVKIIDVMPKDVDSLKSLFASEPITLKQEELIKILECLK